ncbi:MULTISPECIES: beta-ketoacyl synthase N-terminal-like domain-containing protein [Empedobacter]|uniref:Beta-ketoacyl synthase n=2 Tax=Empedobacter TaxID=59734 RepID=A0A427BJI6_9FLAO|nr:MULTISPECIES: beta-ketoacyl synthase N-terminal-like domain-containing protein [Empedobacter]MBY0066756.1 beta-ketoacyl synthase [Empedobacter falsenii]MDH0674595.1 beta-ketoacyl synthase [Empedobacter sp. GD03861]RRT88596.1 beta-ketoacyl synthase [Empedobacter falsenii]RRT89546.1 beta-ketoacyl synthase [Empedobacter falsenii]
MEEKSRIVVMEKVYINRANILTPFGNSIQTNWNELLKGNSAVSKIDSFGHLKNFYAGKIENEIFLNLKNELKDNQHYTRLEIIGISALQSIIEKSKISQRTAFVLSTTKGNIDQLSDSLEKASIPNFAKKIADYFGFKTEPIIISNACVSGVLAVNVAKRFIEIDEFDDAYVLALDELTDFVLTGFNSFQAMDFELCKPFDKDRKGVNLGEAAACVYLSKSQEKNSFQILGESSINDANHISGPSRTGEGLVLSIESAIKEANISSNEIDYISAHGTATLYNDEMEAIAFHRLQMDKTPTNSLKAFYGHTLGASGLLELIIAMKQAEENLVLKSHNFSEIGTSVPLNILNENLQKEVNIILKTSSGFGGSNAVIILKKVQND